MHSDVAIIIPSRLGSVRLANKPLQTIGNIPMIAHVLRQVKLTGLQNIYIATDSNSIVEVVTNYGGQYILTRPECPSGTDRVYEAFQEIPNNQEIKYILNVQGDMPFVEPESILTVIENLKNSNHDIITPVAKVDIEVANSASNVKAVIDNNNKALYFSRSLIPHGASEFLYHIGIYGFRIEALNKFVQLPPSSLELNEKLEQLRALQNNMSIGVCHDTNIPISVDTQEDLDKAIEFYKTHYITNNV